MQPVSPDAHGIAVLLLTAVALFLFTRDRFALESTSLGVLIALIAGFQLFPYTRDGVTLGTTEFFAGFGNEALVSRPLQTIISAHTATSASLPKPAKNSVVPSVTPSRV